MVDLASRLRVGSRDSGDNALMAEYRSLLAPTARFDQMRQQAIDEDQAEDVRIAGFSSLQAIGIRTTDGRASPDDLLSRLMAQGLIAGYTKSRSGK